jgi:hypothetical protein
MADRAIVPRNDEYDEYPWRIAMSNHAQKGVNRIMVKRSNEFVRLSVVAVMIALSGCVGMQPHRSGGAGPQQVAAADSPPPMVQDCGIVTIGSPTKYACNGKTYTSFDLLKLRQDWAKSHGG